MLSSLLTSLRLLSRSIYGLDTQTFEPFFSFFLPNFFDNASSRLIPCQLCPSPTCPNELVCKASSCPSASACTNQTLGEPFTLDLLFLIFYSGPRYALDESCIIVSNGMIGYHDITTTRPELNRASVTIAEAPVYPATWYVQPLEQTTCFSITSRRSYKDLASVTHVLTLSGR